MKPKVTIGMCGRNCQDVVAKALESIARQNFPHDLMEVVFVDDGSEDDTARLVKNCLSRMDVAWRIFSDEWRGLGKARNTVIHNALGDYVIWVDADEILTDNFVRKQVKTIEDNPKAGIVTGRLGIPEHVNLVLALELIPSVVEYSRQDWKSEAKFPGTGGATYRTAAANQVGGFDEEIGAVGEDIDIASRMREAGWLILRGDGVFYETHGSLATWTSLLRRNVNLGVQSRRLYERTGKFYSLLRMNPFASAVAGVLYAVHGYKETRKKMVLLLPFHFSAKMLAWFYGFCQK
jgi:glycosyltransferase involved in cell wall biosynthesis